MTQDFDPHKIEALLRRAHEMAQQVREFGRLCDFGPWLRAERKSRGLKLRDIAEASGLSIGYISDIERSQRKPTMAAAQGIAKALSITEFEVEARVLVGRMAAALEGATP